jgi:uncharacterized membrane protein/predicted DsbA family dithiol-disulfide isomerase
METKRSLRAVGPMLASLLPALAGAAASAMLVVDYVRVAPVFCSESSGCEALKHTAFAMPFGVPLPLVGLVGFVLLGVSSLLPGPRVRFAQVLLAVGAGLAGVLLLFAQLHFGHFCPYCSVADASGVLSLGAAAWRYRKGEDESLALRWPAQAGGAAVLGVAAGVPLVAGFLINPTPRVIHEEIGRTPRGEVTVVDFVDFECPFCRMTHAEIQPILEPVRDKVRMVRRQVPLRMHPHALDAARAACCGERLGKGDAMADALFTSEDLTKEGCEKIAERLGLPLDAFRDCVTSPATDASIESDRSEFKAAGGYALPTIWIDETPIVGAQGGEVVARVLQQALARAGS